MAIEQNTKLFFKYGTQAKYKALEAKDAGLENLKGHRLTNGMRASIYNAMPVEGVQKLRKFMIQFEKENLACTK